MMMMMSSCDNVVPARDERWGHSRPLSDFKKHTLNNSISPLLTIRCCLSPTGPTHRSSMLDNCIFPPAPPSWSSSQRSVRKKFGYVCPVGVSPKSDLPSPFCRTSASDVSRPFPLQCHLRRVPESDAMRSCQTPRSPGGALDPRDVILVRMTVAARHGSQHLVLCRLQCLCVVLSQCPRLRTPKQTRPYRRIEQFQPLL